ncbi:zinc finger protein 282-like isoform X3 [Ambystoma mexicanum]|uniref:zinc finger protein 282-like isoform X3 n=1 Tax=Ambystoma mexicanum TaxID=8296 RepID=UPI0037E827EC
MLQHRPETVPVGQYDVSAYFSEEQWKPLHEWQKELYKNVMNEIHQALVSLGPLIATTVFSLITHESKDLCPVVHQDCERKNLDDHSRGAITAKSVPSSAIKGEENQYVKKSCSTDRSRSNAFSSTGNCTPSPDTSVRIEKSKKLHIGDPVEPMRIPELINASSSEAYPAIPPDVLHQFQEEQDLHSRDWPGSDRAKNSHCPSKGHEFVSFIIKEEEEVCFLDQWDLKNRQSSNLPRTQEEGLNRQRKEGESVETTPVNNVPLRQTNMTALQTSEKETNPRIQPWSSDYWEMDMEKVADIEMGSSNPTHTNVHHVALKERASGPFNEFQTNLKSVSFHQNPMQTQRAYVCTQCGKSFNLRGELVRHMRTHNKIRPYACTECKKSFLKKGDFTRHWRTHTGEKPYACSDCQKRFNLKGNLEQHRILIHSGVRPYQCTQCNKSFTRQSHLLKHIEIHSLVP